MRLSDLQNLDDVTLDKEAVHPDSGELAREGFCASWPASKLAIEKMQAMVKNPIVKFVIGIVITVGDGIAARLCASES